MGVHNGPDAVQVVHCPDNRGCAAVHASKPIPHLAVHWKRWPQGSHVEHSHCVRRDLLDRRCRMIAIPSLGHGSKVTCSLEHEQGLHAQRGPTKSSLPDEYRKSTPSRVSFLIRSKHPSLFRKFGVSMQLMSVRITVPSVALTRLVASEILVQRCLGWVVRPG